MDAILVTQVNPDEHSVAGWRLRYVKWERFYGRHSHLTPEADIQRAAGLFMKELGILTPTCWHVAQLDRGRYVAVPCLCPRGAEGFQAKLARRKKEGKEATGGE